MARVIIDPPGTSEKIFSVKNFVTLVYYAGNLEIITLSGKKTFSMLGTVNNGRKYYLPEIILSAYSSNSYRIWQNPDQTLIYFAPKTQKKFINWFDECIVDANKIMFSKNQFLLGDCCLQKNPDNTINVLFHESLLITDKYNFVLVEYNEGRLIGTKSAIVFNVDQNESKLYDIGIIFVKADRLRYPMLKEFLNQQYHEDPNSI